MEEMTSPEVGAALDAGYDTVLVPCGSVEQHGPHVAMLSDTVQARGLALRVAERMGRTLVAPTIVVGCSDHHMAFPGSLTIRPETLEAIYVDYCRSLARHGFMRIGCFSGHGGNFAPLAGMLPRLRDAATPARVAAFTDLRAYVAPSVEAVVAMGDDPAKVGGHADIAESSAVMALRPDLVYPERAEEGFMGGIEAALAVIFRDGLHSITGNGIIGDARGVNAELGERVLDAATSLLAGYFTRDDVWA